MDTQTNESFEGWCIVELMGHNVIAGYVTEQVIGGAAMLRVDVPEIPDDTRQAFTKFFASSAVYGITPTSEAHARTAAERIRARPVDLWIVPDPKPALPAPEGESDFSYHHPGWHDNEDEAEY